MRWEQLSDWHRVVAISCAVALIVCVGLVAWVAWCDYRDLKKFREQLREEGRRQWDSHKGRR